MFELPSIRLFSAMAILAVGFSFLPFQQSAVAAPAYTKQFVAANQKGNKILIFTRVNGSQPAPDVTLKNLGNECDNPSDVKPRVFNGRSAIAFVSSRCAGILDVITGKYLWRPAKREGTNLHAIEVMPSGEVITADSAGYLRVYSKGGKLKQPKREFPKAHGVVYDKSRVYAIGYRQVRIYKWNTSTGTLGKKIGTIGLSGKKLGSTSKEVTGHDINQLYSYRSEDRKYLLITDSWRTGYIDKNKKTITYFPNSWPIQKAHAKAIGSWPDDQYSLTPNTVDTSGETEPARAFGNPKTFWYNRFSGALLGTSNRSGARFYKIRPLPPKNTRGLYTNGGYYVS